ncbi:VOC family protein [Actinomarinicola tropica]|uniref:Aldoketomutase n=1 Tax=Actinomarinicola tropica TaxID=2789776 RepID=A0A5Q2RDN2_9ACTN|nr:VOC family protein [Actinomarinicola tropica]QGG94989.1 lactoylglutathione lyase [Actinomarinicola tropica]
MTNHMGAVGIAVSDLDRSVDFYTRVLGMTVLTTFELPHMDEAVVGWGRRGAAVVLMRYTDGSDPTTRDLPVKLVLYLDDPVAAADRIRAEGLPIEREPAPVPQLGGAVVGFAKDPDGYTLELLESPDATS